MAYVQSVSLEAVAYDAAAHILRAKFRSDGRVVYENVPQNVYDALIFADQSAVISTTISKARIPRMRSRAKTHNNFWL